MQGWFNQKLNGLLFRWKAFRYGIWYLFSNQYKVPDKLWVGGGYKSFNFKYADKDAFYYEFREICLEDCYGLEAIGKRMPVSTIVDIGSNQGLFLISARKAFPKATVHGYEPNPGLKEVLEHNAGAIKAITFMEAVSDADGLMQLEFGETDLHTVAVKSEAGSVKAISFANVIKRAGGNIDLLKLDCEGGEWVLLEMKDVWEHVHAITMEYHLWAKPGMTTDLLKKKLNDLGFIIIHFSPLKDSFGLLTAVRA